MSIEELVEDLARYLRRAASRREAMVGAGVGALAASPFSTPELARAKKKGKKKPKTPLTPKVRVASGQVNQDNTITALCEDGEVAVGGGFDCFVPYNLIRSAPSPETAGAVPVGWATRITVGSTPGLLTVYAICLPE